ncbi:MAG: hypothetical protein LRZ88_03455 [Candidatus Cloacimonetes bacterium]|nr:hypothetical protein [Candidatus Cloacimonadota bacterium]
MHFFIAGKGEAKAMGISKRFDFEKPYSLSLKEHLQKSIPSMNAVVRKSSSSPALMWRILASANRC